jgi:Pyridoxamine-phosphate oxidase
MYFELIGKEFSGMELEQNTDLFEHFGKGFEEAIASEINDFEAIALASEERKGKALVRRVLLKER